MRPNVSASWLCAPQQHVAVLIYSKRQARPRENLQTLALHYRQHLLRSQQRAVDGALLDPTCRVEHDHICGRLVGEGSSNSQPLARPQRLTRLVRTARLRVAVVEFSSTRNFDTSSEYLLRRTISWSPYRMTSRCVASWRGVISEVCTSAQTTPTAAGHCRGGGLLLSGACFRMRDRIAATTVGVVTACSVDVTAPRESAMCAAAAPAPTPMANSSGCMRRALFTIMV